MDQNTNLMASYNAGFYVCMVVMIIALVGAVVLFFVFDIRNNFLIRIGHAEKVSIKKKQIENARTGTLRQKIDMDYTTDRLADSPGNSGGDETTSLNAGSNETTFLGEQTSPMHGSLVMTEVLETPKIPEGFKFTIIENTLIIHTEEVV